MLAKLRAVAKRTYTTLAPCVRTGKRTRAAQWNFPSDALEHYAQIMNITKPFRGMVPHRKDSYAGSSPKMRAAKLALAAGSTADADRAAAAAEDPNWPPYEDTYGSGKSIADQMWVENHFVEAFSEKPLEYFRGLIPLLVQWSDYQLQAKWSHQTKLADMKARGLSTDGEMTPKEASDPAHIFAQLLATLRPDALYVTVSQANRGLPFAIFDHPNIIVLNAGGVGNIPIPLVKGEVPFFDPFVEFPLQASSGATKAPAAAPPMGAATQTSHARSNQILKPLGSSGAHIIFLGSVGHSSTRKKSVGDMSAAVIKVNAHLRERSTKQKIIPSGHRQGQGQGQGMSSNMGEAGSLEEIVFKQGSFPSPAWIEHVANSTFILTPRGFGRQSFRFSEIMQIGRVPLYIYDDYAWLPYAGTEIDFISQPLSEVPFAGSSSKAQDVRAKGNQMQANEVDDSEALSLNLNVQASVAGLPLVNSLLALLEEQATHDALVLHQPHRSHPSTRLMKILSNMKQIRHFYTYSGVIEQIDAFFHDPLNAMGSNGYRRNQAGESASSGAGAGTDTGQKYWSQQTGKVWAKSSNGRRTGTGTGTGEERVMWQWQERGRPAGNHLRCHHWPNLEAAANVLDNLIS